MWNASVVAAPSPGVGGSVLGEDHDEQGVSQRSADPGQDVDLRGGVG
jgi:hypothetical protein